MSHDYLTERAADATSPFEHEMSGVGRGGAFVGDRYSIAYHSYAHSHMDSLCHMAHDGVMFNGFTRADHVSESGCGKLAILDVKHGILTKGVLMDIARLNGVDYMDSLCHMAHDGVMFNGFTRADHVSESGCGKLAILDVKHGILTKGVLMDIARLNGVDYLEPGTQIYVEDLEAWGDGASPQAPRGG